MRRLFPLFGALACLLFWGMLPAQGVNASWREMEGGKAGEKLSALPPADLDGEGQPGGLAAAGGAGDLVAETPRGAFIAAPVMAPHEAALLSDRRAATLVGIVVLLI